jgi:hypothetical protein
MPNVGYATKDRRHHYQIRHGQYLPIAVSDWMSEDLDFERRHDYAMCGYESPEAALDLRKLIRIDPDGGHRSGGVSWSQEMQRTQFIGATAAGLAVLGLGCSAGSLFAFGAALGYGFSWLAGVGLVAMGVVALLVATYLGSLTMRRISRAEGMTSTSQVRFAPKH